MRAAVLQVYGLVGSQLTDLGDASQPANLMTNLEGQTQTISEYLRHSYGYHHNFIGYCALVLAGFIMMFHVVTATAHIKFNFQKR